MRAHLLPNTFTRLRFGRDGMKGYTLYDGSNEDMRDLKVILGRCGIKPKEMNGEEWKGPVSRESMMNLTSGLADTHDDFITKDIIDTSVGGIETLTRLTIANTRMHLYISDGRAKLMVFFNVIRVSENNPGVIQPIGAVITNLDSSPKSKNSALFPFAFLDIFNGCDAAI